MGFKDRVANRKRGTKPSGASLWTIMKKVRDLLSVSERRRGLLLLVMISIMALLETTSVASIMPFIMVLTHPDVVESNRYLSLAYHSLGFQDADKFLFFLGFVVLGVVVGSTAFRAFTTWAMLRFAATRSYTLSRRLFTAYLHRPYEWFLNQHSADLGKSVLSEVQQVVVGALIPAMQIFSQAALAALLIALLMVVNPFLALTVTVILGGLYIAIILASRAYLSAIGADRLRSNMERFRICSEAFSGIKDIKLLGLEDAFLTRFQSPAKRFAKHQAASQTISQLPQFAIQTIAISGVLVIILYQLLRNGSNYETLSLLALYAIAGYRLMPALQRIYQSTAQMRFAEPAVDVLYKDLIETPRDGDRKSPKGQRPLRLLSKLEFRDLSYSYPSAAGSALKGVSLTIPAASTVGFVGRTGAGKTTAVDILLGLLEPTAGQLLVDGTNIAGGNRRAWQRSVGYVPQHIFIADDTVAANIAFGVERDEIDIASVEAAARIANLHEVVVQELEQGYNTLLGERGLRLSGGQRQRVGIARALYRDPDVIVMDEATSALDNITERAVMDAVANLRHRKTIVIVAHRLSTVQRCDRIFVLDSGSIVASGTYRELVEENEQFRAMVNSIELAS
jgi:ABC-type multidrug transport system fused ATPase/permease subunit